MIGWYYQSLNQRTVTKVFSELKCTCFSFINYIGDDML